MFFRDQDYEFDKHFRTRATGQLYLGPLGGDGYDNRVLQITTNELEFGNSKEAARFLERQRERYENRSDKSQKRKLKMISRLDNDN